MAGVSKRSTVALLCYFLPQWCYFSFLVMKGAANHMTHGATATVACATAKWSLDTPEWEFAQFLQNVACSEGTYSFNCWYDLKHQF